MNIKKMLLLLFAIVAYSGLGAQPKSLPLILDMVHDNPGEKPYESQFNQPEVLKKMGYNGKVFSLFKSAQLAVDWSEVDPDIMPIGSPERQWVDKKAAQLDSLYSGIKNAGLQVYCMSDLILFPKRLIEKYGLQDVMGDPRNPQTEKYLRLLLDQMFTRFPQLDGIVVRIGETYLHDAPYHLGKITDKGDPEKCIIPLINILRDEVCVKLNKKVIFRTWWSFDTDIDTYMAVDKAVEPHDNLTIGIKHCEGDFHRGNPFSKVLGIGRHKQLVEVQCAREYEGKGAYPNYIAKGVIDGFEEHQSLREQGKAASIQDIYKTGKLTGMWTWTRGGGWEGPYIQNELWCDLNAFVMAQWAKNPKETEESIFNRYTRERLGLSKTDAAKFRKLALLSADAVIRGRRSVAFYNDVHTLWTRDEYIGFPTIPAEPAKIKVILKEKNQSIVMWKEIVALADKIKFKDNKTGDFVKVTARYGFELYRIYRAVFYLSAIDKGLYTKTEEKKWIDEYDAAWVDYQNLAKNNPNCPTLYSKDKVLRSWFKPADGEINRMRNELALSGKMMYGDSFRDGVPFAKDPYVISFGGRYLIYYSLHGYTDKAGTSHGWGVGIAESKDLKNWKRIGEVNPDPKATYEAKGFVAPCALVSDGKVNLFYQTCGNGTKDAKSADGINWTRLSDQPFLPNSKPGEWNSSESGHPHIFANPNGDDYLFFQGNNDNGKTWYLSNVEII